MHRLGMWLIAAVAVGACDRPPTRIELELLAEGEWTIADDAHGRVLLRQQRTHNRPARGRPAEPVVAMLRDSLESAELQTLALPAGASVIEIVRAIAGADTFYFAGSGVSPFTRSPADPRLYLFEYENGIWVFNAPTGLNKLTLDDGLDSLRSLQREGEVILYWATAPMWSGDGEFISFLTNRHGLRAPSAQGIWVVQARTGTQKELLIPPNASLHTDGVFGEEFVFSSNTEPGVHGVHPRTSATRKYSDGYLVGFHPAGKAMLVNAGERHVLFRGEQRDTLPVPPRGQIYTSHAHFSPAGERLAIFSTDQQGAYELHVFDASMQRLSIAVPGGPSYGPRWISEDNLLLAATRPRESTRTYRAHLR
ncbi:MAG TPA: hypothetical protein VGD27_06690 [Longimicrobiales bacterium]